MSSSASLTVQLSSLRSEPIMLSFTAQPSPNDYAAPPSSEPFDASSAPNQRRLRRWFEEVPEAERPADWLDCPVTAPPFMRPIYEKISEAELPADPMDYSAADPAGYRRIKYPPVKQKEEPSPPTAVATPNGKVRKQLSRVWEVRFGLFHLMVMVVLTGGTQAFVSNK
ncbi:hypothetical protein K503DRAFT_802708 [Rhizopogon vinicolor AM-OR11-026]|uniref:Uncharacterized protein n=1 Tax=Rhizopogon vinicolor AM-OR11-026 TaxID=1314800 RepID=A0A1B7MSI4_9AGAM|nr:hypothetical protein K503DRAFT_802708 [Rhizopogon vinicolor AM-OR11-026]